MKKTIIFIVSLFCFSHMYCMESKPKKSPKVPSLNFRSSSPKPGSRSNSPKPEKLTSSSGGVGTPKTPVKNMKELGAELHRVRNSQGHSEEDSSQKK